MCRLPSALPGPGPLLALLYCYLLHTTRGGSHPHAGRKGRVHTPMVSRTHVASDFVNSDLQYFPKNHNSVPSRSGSGRSYRSSGKAQDFSETTNHGFNPSDTMKGVNFNTHDKESSSAEDEQQKGSPFPLDASRPVERNDINPKLPQFHHQNSDQQTAEISTYYRHPQTDYHSYQQRKRKGGGEGNQFLQGEQGYNLDLYTRTEQQSIYHLYLDEQEEEQQEDQWTASHPNADTKKSDGEAFAELLRVKDVYAARAQEEERRRKTSCTQTQFPRGTRSSVGQAGFSSDGQGDTGDEDGNIRDEHSGDIDDMDSGDVGDTDSQSTADEDIRQDATAGLSGVADSGARSPSSRGRRARFLGSTFPQHHLRHRRSKKVPPAGLKDAQQWPSSRPGLSNDEEQRQRSHRQGSWYTGATTDSRSSRARQRFNLGTKSEEGGVSDIPSVQGTFYSEVSSGSRGDEPPTQNYSRRVRSSGVAPSSNARASARLASSQRADHSSRKHFSAGRPAPPGIRSSSGLRPARGPSSPTRSPSSLKYPSRTGSTAKDSSRKRGPSKSESASRKQTSDSEPSPTMDAPPESVWGQAVHFSGSEVLRLKGPAFVSPGRELPRRTFTAEFWVRPEGGQHNPAIILGVWSTCASVSSEGFWAVGVRTYDSMTTTHSQADNMDHTDARFSFSLRTARAQGETTLFAHTRYEPGVWTHVAVVYDGSKMAIYINGARVRVSDQQVRDVFPGGSAPCLALTLGGPLRGKVTSRGGGGGVTSTSRSSGEGRFRGTVDELRVWGRALSHREIVESVQRVMDQTQWAKSAGTSQDTHVTVGTSSSSSTPSSSSSFSSRTGAFSSQDMHLPAQSADVHQRDSSRHSSQSVGGRVDNQRDMSSLPHDSRQDYSPQTDLYVHETFVNLSRWSVDEGGRSVRLIPSDLQRSPYDLSVSIPPCGQTPCDSPDVVLSYAADWQLRAHKTIRYRVVNLMNDDSSDPTVTDLQILKQHEALNRAFRPYNISFRLDVHSVRNTTLRQRLIMFGCEPENVGDGFCNPECMHTRTGEDGGDCDPVRVKCDARNKGNGRCDFACNKHYHDWDGGDCCLPGPDTHYTCYDPKSPYRGYVAVDQFRDIVGLRADNRLNVFFAQWTTDHLIGLATFPWEKHIYSVQGGTVVQPQTFGTDGQMDSLVHEIGHNFGLWHVHHGVSEVDCSDPCAETEASMELGDLCEDTQPTPQNVHCGDPGLAEDQCGLMTSYRNTPYRSYMSYADDNCTEHFTPQQVARMHCYLDLAYQPWTVSRKPAPVPLPPRVVSADADSVTVAWVPPLGQVTGRVGSVCNLCDPRAALVQFAASASSPAPDTGTTRWAPVQATGPPDAEPCVPSVRAWLPEVPLCTKRACMLEMVLDKPVIADTITLWVTWNADGVRRIRLIFVDGSSSVLKVTPAFCDIPFTAKVNSDKRLKKVRVYTRMPFTAIDALQVVSRPGDARCQACEPVKYRVFRRPGLKGDYFRLTTDTHFTDNEVVRGTSYLYWVESEADSKPSQPSPVLHYRHGQRFCGDGRLDSDQGEECDDGNLRSGDGCDVKCRMEPTFHCKGVPSLCYRHEGDGECEEFERETSVLDCGFYTPPGFIDQWAHDAIANSEHQLPVCPARIATGAPELTQGCGPIVDPKTAWFPCGAQFEKANFWIQFYFPRAVVATEVIVHVAADGRTEGDPVPKTISLELLTTDNSSVVLTPRPLTLTCRDYQLRVPVVHDLSKPFYKSRGVRLTFQSFNISIAGVRLRSSRYLDPVTLASCGSEEVFSLQSGLCLSRNCSRALCPPFLPKHGRALCTGHSDGDICTVTCDKGYKPESHTMEVACRGGHWSSPHPVSCLPVECHLPTIPHATMSCQHGTSFGQNCTFQCRPPARVKGTDNWVVCEEDGLWSTPGASCLVTCPPPLNVPHASRPKRRCRSGAQDVGTRCKFKCKKGYHVAGARSTRRVFRLTCDSDGSWTGEHCERVTCPRFDPVFSGLVTCTDGVTVNSQCSLACPGGQEVQTVTCNINGQWSSALTQCSSFDDVTCPFPVGGGGDLSFRCSQLSVGSRCVLTCSTPDDEPIYVTSGDSTSASSVQGEVVRALTCTGTGVWFPPINKLLCVQKCSTEFIGDKLCDARNNRQYCNWDGGDCCPSTLGGKVKPFPESCRAECTCKDPLARENAGTGDRHGKNG